jgi:hypothetical protein
MTAVVFAEVSSISHFDHTVPTAPRKLEAKANA